MRCYIMLFFLLTSRLYGQCTVAGMDVSADLLYLRPQLGGLNIAVVDARPHGDPTTAALSGVDLFLPSGQLVGICPDRVAAFQVGVAYLFCQGHRDLHFGYTGLWSCYAKSAGVQGEGGLWIVDGHPRYDNLRLNGASVANNVPNALVDTAEKTPRAHQHSQLEHNRVDGAWAWRGWKSSSAWTRTFIGIRWANVCLRQSADYLGVVSFVGPNAEQQPVRIVANQLSHAYEKVETWGIGPVVGWNMHYHLGRGFAISAHAAASLLVGKRRHHLSQFVLRQSLVLGVDPVNDVDEVLDLSTPPMGAYVPEGDARLGLSYCWCCGRRFTLLMECGWEFVTYIGGISRLALNDHAGTGREGCENFSLDGLYLSIRVRI